ncbi:Ras-specific guanine nucleotide-releasing factor 2, partial [Operophtera brumata]
TISQVVGKGRRASLQARQAFLFSNYLLLTASDSPYQLACSRRAPPCMESAALCALLRACGACGASASLPACRSDRALFTDDVDIRFSRTLNSCKVPQIRSATPQRLLQRLTVTVLEALKQVFYEQSQQEMELAPPPDTANRKTSAASSVSDYSNAGYGSEYSERDWQARFWRASRRSEEEDKLSPYLMAPSRRLSSVSKPEEDNSHLTIPKIMATSSSNETLKGTSPSSPGAISSVTLVGSPKKFNPLDPPKAENKSPTKDNDKAAKTLMKDESIELVDQSDEDIKYKEEEPEKIKFKEEKFKMSQRFSERVRTMSESPRRSLQPPGPSGDARRRSDSAKDAPASANEPRRASDSTASERRYTNSSINSERRRHWGGSSEPRSSVTSQVSQVAQNYRRETGQPKAGVVITSFRQSHRRSSTSTAAAAFAVATSASSNPRSPPTTSPPATRRDSVISTAATMRVLNVLRHWICKHSYDFWSDERLRGLTMDFLKEIEGSPGLLPAEHKAASQLLRLLERAPDRTVDLKVLFAPPPVPTNESVETLSALEIAEQMTYLDYQIFREFLGQAWTKADKADRAPHILMMTGHFNHISNLVVSEILKKFSLAVADIARCLHNFNGVLQMRPSLYSLPRNVFVGPIIAHVIREIRNFQQTPYKIDHIT